MGTKHKDEEAIFNAALAWKSPGERTAYLKRVCGGDVDLLARLEALLKVKDQEYSALEAAARHLGATLEDAPLTEGPGTVIGKYKLLEKIGEGGMASVYMAEQKEPVRRKVALKIIKLGMDTKQVIARFEVERQALALMDHPHIAKVHDAGATESGRPYFVMELVKGVSITKYCDMNNLNTRDRLDLFISICQAIQHAHQKGIIHRDIKPSNVMVTMHDGQPVPMVIDFGIAKATNQQLTEKTLFTHYAQMIGTPEYMSPEQAEMSGLDIDTRTDIYSLGVLLYELLTGATPLDADTLRKAGYNEIQRIIREQEPDKPSTKLSTLKETMTDIAKRRNTSPEALQKLIKGDLDWVVMKSLEKDRTRRYGTAAELAAEIERHLNNEPVLAVAPSLTYKLSKFVRRNRSLVTGAAIVLVVLVAGIVSSTMFAVWENRARDEAEQAKITAEEARIAESQQRQFAEKSRLEAEQEREKAETALMLLLQGDTIDSIAILPFTYIGGRQELEYLRVGIPDMIETCLIKLPGLSVRSFDTIISSYGENPQDPLLVGKKFDVKGVITGTIIDHDNNITINLEIVETKNNVRFNLKFEEPLANLHNIPAKIAQKISEPLKVQFTDEQARQAFMPATNNPEAIRNYMTGRKHFRKRTKEGLDRAIIFFEEATIIDPEYAEAFSGLADAHLLRGYYAGVPNYIYLPKARGAAEKALNINKDLAETHTSMGFVFHHMQKYERAIKEFKRAIEINPNYALAYYWLGYVYEIMGNYEKSFKNYEKALDLDPMNSSIYSNLGVCYQRSGQKQKAIEQHSIAIKINPKSARVYSFGAYTLAHFGDYAKAVKQSERAREIDPLTYGHNNEMVGIYSSAGQFNKAISQNKRLIELYSKSPNAFNTLASVLRTWGGEDKVIEEFREIIRQYPQSPDAFSYLGIAYRNTGEFDQAIEQHQKSIRLAPEYPEAHNNMALNYKAIGEYDKAEEYFKQAIDYSPAPLTFIANLGTFYIERGDNEKAYKLYEEALVGDPDWGGLYTNFGRLCRDNYEYVKAVEIFAEAVRRFPDNISLGYDYAKTLSFIGAHERAVEQFKKVYEFDTSSWGNNNRMGLIYYFARDFEKAVEYFKKAAGIVPTDLTATGNLARAYLNNEQYTEAAEVFRRHFSLSKIPNAEGIFEKTFAAGQYHKSSLQAYLRDILQESDNAKKPFAPRIKAYYYAYIGENDMAMELLERAFAAKDNLLAGGVNTIWFDDLRSERRFQGLLKKLKLDKYFIK